MSNLNISVDNNLIMQKQKQKDLNEVHTRLMSLRSSHSLSLNGIQQNATQVRNYLNKQKAQIERASESFFPSSEPFVNPNRFLSKISQASQLCFEFEVALLTITSIEQEATNEINRCIAILDKDLELLKMCLPGKSGIFSRFKRFLIKLKLRSMLKALVEEKGSLEYYLAQEMSLRYSCYELWSCSIDSFNRDLGYRSDLFLKTYAFSRSEFPKEAASVLN